MSAINNSTNITNELTTEKNQSRQLKTAHSFGVTTVTTVTKKGLLGKPKTIKTLSKNNPEQEDIKTELDTVDKTDDVTVKIDDNYYLHSNKDLLLEDYLYTHLDKHRFIRIVTRLFLTVFIILFCVALVASSIGLVIKQTNSIHLQYSPYTLEPLATPSVIYDSSNNPIDLFGNSDYRIPIPLSQVPILVQNAILSAEDHAFWQHGALDFRSILRAAFNNLKGEPTQGGSTITQQLVKIDVLQPKNGRTFAWKIRETMVAEQLFKKLGRNAILQRYLNSVYFGHGAYGIEAASNIYFGKTVNQLDIAQASLLAGLIRSPSLYDPIKNPILALQRRSEVIAQEVQYGFITYIQGFQADNEPLPTNITNPVLYPTNSYLVAVEQSLLSNPALGKTVAEREKMLFTKGLQIYTNYNQNIENNAQQIVSNDLPNTNGRFTASLASVNPTNGDVLAIVSGNPSNNPFGFNIADGNGTPGRQPGSSFKIFTLITALEQGINPNEVLDGTSPCTLDFPGFQPYVTQNDTPGYGYVSIINATAFSINCAYEHLGLQVGLNNIVKTATQMGIPNITPLPSVILGTENATPLAMASAYGIVANNGVYFPPSFVNKITKGNKTLYLQSSVGKQLISPSIANQTAQILQSVVQYGTGTAASISGVSVSGKTGTTDNEENAWFDGFVPGQIATSVWMGDPITSLPMKNVGGITVYGATYPTQIWHDFTVSYLASH